jgi:hypothetical protein
MDQLIQQSILCPYCGEIIEVLIDPSDAGQEYIEDCQVCCRPIVFSIATADCEQLRIDVRAENDC